MELIDDTPFSTLTFESVTLEGDSLQIVVVRGTFSIVPDEVLRPISEQLPVVAADEYYGKPNESSIRCPNDLAPFKPNSDVIINATAHSPSGGLERNWPVSIRVGKLEKSLIVTGSRAWKHRPFLGWHLSDPEPCLSVPIRYELAFGGQWKDGDLAGVWETNPIGCGFASSDHLPSDGVLKAPQIIGPNQEVPGPGQAGRTEGLGGIAPAWMPRRQFAGTYDDDWTAHRAPLLPLDFKYDFYSAAHPDLVYDGFLRGGEEVNLNGLTPTGHLRFYLPKYDFGFVLTDRANYRYGSVAELDTLQIDLEQRQVTLVWRAGAPIFEDGVARIQVKMNAASTAV